MKWDVIERNRYLALYRLEYYRDWKVRANSTLEPHRTDEHIVNIFQDSRRVYGNGRVYLFQYSNVRVQAPFVRDWVAVISPLLPINERKDLIAKRDRSNYFWDSKSNTHSPVNARQEENYPRIDFWLKLVTQRKW